MNGRIAVVTGTDTGVGKTVLSAALTRLLVARGLRVAALKPICSGGRGDARMLRRAAGSGLSLEEVNPWTYRAALAPLAAARLEKKRLRIGPVARHIRQVARGFDLALVESAGGLLSPLGEGFDTRDLIRELAAWSIVVAPNRLGVVNQVRLVLEALPPECAGVDVILVAQQNARGTSGNLALLSEYVDARRIHVLPWLTKPGALLAGPPLDQLGRLAAHVSGSS